MLTAKQLRQLDQRDVNLGLYRSQNRTAIGFDVMRAQVATLWQSRHPALGAPGADPTNGSRNRDTETLSRRIARQAIGNDGDEPRAKILG